MVREKVFFQGQGKVREFYFKTGKIDIYTNNLINSLNRFTVM